jgi:hypothetical protein|tara:strand:- start:1805 stop:2398 length:594 start_codon:yes stop_codon:yes gene_type:complete
MKKFLTALLFMLPISVYALDVDFVSDVSIASHGVTIGLDQDGDKFSVGAAGLTVSTSDTSQIGIEYGSTILGVTGSVSYDYTVNDEHLLGFDTSTSLLGVELDAGVDWNIDDTSFAGTVGTGYSVFDLDGKVTTNWDLDDFAYEGLDLDVGYTWGVTDNFSVRPNVTIPFDDDFNRGDLIAGVSVNLSFGSTSTDNP